jgi:hypothetical protein
LAFRRGGQQFGQIQVTAPPFCDTDSDNRGSLSGYLPWADQAMVSTVIEWMAITSMGLYLFLIADDC